MHYRGIFCLHELKDFVLFLHVDFLQGVDIGERAQEQARSWVNNNEEHINTCCLFLNNRRCFKEKYSYFFEIEYEILILWPDILFRIGQRR